MNENNVEPKMDLEFDDNWNGVLVIECTKCGTITKKKLSELNAGDQVDCSCGISFSFSGDDLSGIQSSLDSLKKTLKSFS